MRGWEALKALEKGQRLRVKTWESGKFVWLQNGNMRDELGFARNFETSNSLFIGDEWEAVQDFHDIKWAIKQLGNSLSVRRSAWVEHASIEEVDDRLFWVGYGYKWTPTEEDLLAEDWVLA